jgi:hypothetical protein
MAWRRMRPSAKGMKPAVPKTVPDAAPVLPIVAKEQTS